jgi:hypothetical protein
LISIEQQKGNDTHTHTHVKLRRGKRQRVCAFKLV